jgi:hypothetical protein
MSETNVTLLVAVISAVVALFGYFYQKRQEREFALATLRREIYQRLVKNLTRRLSAIPSMLKDPIFAQAKDPTLSPEQAVELMYAIIREKYPAVWENFTEALEINTLLCIYGTDPAVKKAASVQRQSAQIGQAFSKDSAEVSRLEAVDLPGLVLTLRKSVSGPSRDLENTVVTREEIGLLLSM